MLSAFAICAFPSTVSAATLTDLTVFSTNSDGHAYYSLIWNTEGAPDNRFNLYVSTSADFSTPIFINGGNEASASVAIDLQPGTYYFTLFGESAFTPIPSDVHSVTNLYFDGNQSSPGISGMYGAACPTVCAADSTNGMNIGGTGFQAEAGTLSWSDGSVMVNLTEFTWITDRQDIDAIWPYWSNVLPYDDGSGTPDFVGTLRLEVTSVPEPGTAALLLLGGVGATLRRFRRRA